MTQTMPEAVLGTARTRTVNALIGLLVLRGRWRPATTPDQLHTPAALPLVTPGRGQR
jgi:hypothetical protein